MGLALRALEPLMDAEAGRMGAEISRLGLCADELPAFVPDAAAGLSAIRGVLDALCADEREPFPRIGRSQSRACPRRRNPCSARAVFAGLPRVGAAL